jgi:hypothetical protein
MKNVKQQLLTTMVAVLCHLVRSSRHNNRTTERDSLKSRPVGLVLCRRAIATERHTDKMTEMLGQQN